MKFERTWIEEPDVEWVIVKTDPQHSDRRDYWFRRWNGVLVLSGYCTGHALEYLKKNVDIPVVERKLDENQLRLTDFSNEVDDRTATCAVG